MKRSYYEAIILRRNHIVIDRKRKSIIMIYDEIRFVFIKHCSCSCEGRRTGDDGLNGRRCHDRQEWQSNAEIWPVTQRYDRRDRDMAVDTDRWLARQMLANETDAGRRDKWWPARQMAGEAGGGRRDRSWPARQMVAGEADDGETDRGRRDRFCFSLFFCVIWFAWFVS